MLVLNNANYKLKEDISDYLATSHKTIDDFSEITKIGKRTISDILSDKANVTPSLLETIYSTMYDDNYPLNAIKEEINKERKNELIVYHGSKFGLKEIDINTSRTDTDFGSGFYLGESFSQAASFIGKYPDSAVYSFILDKSDINYISLDHSFEWLILICYNRGFIKKYENHPYVKDIIKIADLCDLIIAPIANNKMYYIMRDFAEGEITVETAIHALSASSLGMQYVIKTETGLKSLKFLEKMYLCKEERNKYINMEVERSKLIDNKYKYCRKQFNGESNTIEEALK